MTRVPDLTYRLVIAALPRPVPGARPADRRCPARDRLPADRAGGRRGEPQQLPRLHVRRPGRDAARAAGAVHGQGVGVPVAGSSGPLMRAMQPHPRSTGRTASSRPAQALRALQAGEVVGIYPEATIGRAFVVKDREDFRRGAAYLALATGAPLVPVAHWGIHRIFTVDGRYSLRRGKAVEVRRRRAPRAAAGRGRRSPHRPAARPARRDGRRARRRATRSRRPIRRSAWWWPASRRWRGTDARRSPAALDDAAVAEPTPAADPPAVC